MFASDWANIQDWIGTAAAVVTAVATIVLARLTFVLARATNKLAEARPEPFIVLTIEESPHGAPAFDVYISNTGSAAAFDVEIKVDPPISCGRAAIEEFHISPMRPGQRVRVNAITGGEIHDKQYRVSSSWKNDLGKDQIASRNYVVRGIDEVGMWEERRGIHNVAVEMEAIRKTLENRP